MVRHVQLNGIRNTKQQDVFTVPQFSHRRNEIEPLVSVEPVIHNLSEIRGRQA